MDGSVDPLAALERRVLERWRERDIAGKARRLREGAPVRVIWERPGAACRDPAGELGARVLADVFARYATMRGWQVDRRGARDCHDPSVEVGVERGLRGAPATNGRRPDVAELAARCRAAALQSAAELDALSARLGLQQAGDELPRTLHPDYVESVWWAVKEIAGQGRLHEKLKVVPYCPRCATGLTDGEVAHADVEQWSAIVRFAVARDGGPLQAGDDLLVATDDPWQLLGNAAVAVDPELTYVRAKTGTLDAPVVLAEALVERVLGAHAAVRVLERFRGAAIDGVRYEPPLQYLPAGAFGERGHSVLLAGFVTATAGTGLHAVAPAFGEDDRRLGDRYGLAVVNPLAPNGTFDERSGRYAGRLARDVSPVLVGDLCARGRVLGAEARTSAAPACAACGTPLLPYAKTAWFVTTPRVRGDADVLVSSDRCWGTPLPVWRCEHGHVTVVGSFDELAQRSGSRLADPHRPHADDISFACDCGAQSLRVPELVAPWFDTAAMPFARRHEPFAGELTLDELYPADLACATAGEVAALATVSALLRGDEHVCEHVVRVRAADAAGRSSDARRWHILGAGAEDRELPRQLWDACALASADGAGSPLGAPAGDREPDRWIVARLAAAIAIAGERLDGYDAPGAAAAAGVFADELCDRYLPRVRERLRDGDPAAGHVLRHCLLALARLLAPFTPFVADEVYERLHGGEPSVHLADWPVAGELDLEAA